MSARYPALGHEEPITGEMITAGLRFMTPASRTYLDVGANYITLHLALWCDQAQEDRIIIPAGTIAEKYRPAFPTRGIMPKGSGFATVLWRPNGQAEIEGQRLSDGGTWINGFVEAKRVLYP